MPKQPFPPRMQRPHLARFIGLLFPRSRKLHHESILLPQCSRSPFQPKCVSKTKARREGVRHSGVLFGKNDNELLFCRRFAAAQLTEKQHIPCRMGHQHGTWFSLKPECLFLPRRHDRAVTLNFPLYFSSFLFYHISVKSLMGKSKAAPVQREGASGESARQWPPEDRPGEACEQAR